MALFFNSAPGTVKGTQGLIPSSVSLVQAYYNMEKHPKVSTQVYVWHIFSNELNTSFLLGGQVVN